MKCATNISLPIRLCTDIANYMNEKMKLTSLIATCVMQVFGGNIAILYMLSMFTQTFFKTKVHDLEKLFEE